MATFTLTAGLDALTGSSTADIFNVTLASHLGANDFIVGGAGIDTLQFSGTAGVLVLDDRVDEIELVFLGGSAAIGVNAFDGLGALSIAGNTGANAITGTFLADTITGGAGADTLSGGGGNDVFLVGLVTDMVAGEVLNGGGGTDVLRFTGTAGTLVLSANVTNLEQVVIGTAAGLTTGIAAINVDASAVTYALSITGNAGANVLTGTALDDTLSGGAGNDVFIVKAGAHHGAGEAIDGGAGMNVIRFTSTTASDVLVLSATISGIAEAEASDAAGLNAGTAAVGIDASALSAGMLLTGNAGANELTGTQGADTINGGAGADALDGGSGSDIFLIASGSDHAEGEGIDGGLGQDTIRFTSIAAAQTLTLQAGVTGIENIAIASAVGLTTGTTVLHVNAAASTENLAIAGNAGANSLTGGSGNDTITGGAGADTLDGGGGDDLFLAGSIAEIPATEQRIGGTGTDTLRYTGATAATLTFTATALNGVEAVEIASVAGSFAGTALIHVNAAALSSGIRITANDGANSITGGAGADTLEGGGGNDLFLIGNSTHHGTGEVVSGGAGTDTIRFTSTTAGQVLTLQAGVTGVESVQVATAAGATTGSTALHITAAALASGIGLTGNAGSNSITGGTGADTITGGAGNDTLAGGDGNDLFIVALATELTVAEQVNGGANLDTLRLVGAGTYALTANVTNLERVEAAAGAAAVNINAAAVASGLEIAGNAGVNSITGTGQADTITGGAGADSLAGGGGNDFFMAASGADLAGDTLNGGFGADTLVFTSTTAGDTLALTAGVSALEIVLIADADLSTTGTTALSVDASHQTAGLEITGNDGPNVITGGSGADTIGGEAGNDLLAGMSGADSIYGGQGNDSITGGAGNDTLAGEDGADILKGGLGNDVLRGGGGNDKFTYDAADSLIDGGSGTDTLTVTGSGVSLDLNAAAEARVSGMEVIDLTGRGNNTLMIDGAGIAAQTEGAPELRVKGNAGDAVQVDTGWVRGTDTVIGADTYRQYTHADAAGVTLQVDEDVAFHAVFPLARIDGANGFRISGEAAGDGSGGSVSSAGDVNGDGFDDLIVGASGADPNGNYSGASYVLFGQASGFASNLNLSALNGANGFQISGEATFDFSGRSVSSAGDVNGDGFDDLIGTSGADRNGIGSGASYVLFGQASGFASNLNLSALNGANGFQISGEATFDFSGRSVSSAGDVNGDGFDDLIVGASDADPNGDGSGASYVVFGQASGSASNVNLSALDGANGFQLSGEAAGDHSGRSVSSAGDVNGDGFDDLIVGASSADLYGYFSGASYVVFGQASGFASNVNLSALDGSNGFQISGEAAGDYSGNSVSSAGDVNGDGIDDLIIGAEYADPNGNAYSGASYVVFGQASGFASNLNLSALDGVNGFQITGEAVDDRSGHSVSTAGDVNGDGFDDLIVGAHLADPNGNYSGASYVVFGQASGFASNVNLSALDGTNGFRISGEAAGDYSGRSVSSAGDVNGDGFDDLIVGASGADPNGSNSGASYVLFGRDFRNEADQIGGSGANALTGTAANEILVGGLGNDTLDGAGGNDVLRGGGGNDAFTYDVADRLIDGGSGTDTLTVTGSGVSLDLTAAAEARVSGIEVVDLTGSGNNTLAIDVAGLVAQTEGVHELRVKGNAGDVVSADGLWTNAGTVTIEGVAYTEYTQGPATLFAQNGVNTSGNFELTVNVQLSTLNGTNGFQISGEAAGDFSGRSVSSAGDVNGDGFGDLIVGAFLAHANGNGSAGASYVVFGKGSAFRANLDLSALDGTNGFQLSGEAVSDWSGRSVSSAGDVNGDGFDDLIVGAYFADPNGNLSGASYVVFGKASGFASNINLSALNGTNGFQLSGEATDDYSGRSVSSAGDVNGDGFDDLVVGAWGADPNGNASGASYVVFGQVSGFASNLNLSALNGANGFQISGEAAYDRSGHSVSAAGDVNGDGFDDLIVSAYRADPNGDRSGASYVVFGQASGFASNLNLSALDGANGFQISGEAAGDYSGRSVSAAGDVNGDGFDDMIVGADRADPNGNWSGASYVVFGQASEFAANLNLSALNGTNGFQLSGEAEGDHSGDSVSSAGDVNGDGFDDLIVGAANADPNGNASGASYVVFGQASGFASNVNLSALEDMNGFQISGEAAGDYSGVSVSAAGDVNGDGFDDLIVGAFFADPNGNSSGASYVVFGRDFDFRNEADQLGTSGGDALTGTAGNEILIGGLGNDTLDGAGGADVLKGGGGNDAVTGGSGNDVLEGDSGSDLLDGGADVDRLYGDEGADTLDGGTGNDTLTGGGDNDVFLFNDALGASNVDTIMDFGGAGSATLDAIHLENAIFTALFFPGALNATNFVANGTGTATTAAHFIVFNTATGELFYDADGSGGGAAVKFAVIATDPDGLAASDFFVI